MATAVNIESIEEAKRQVAAARELITKLKNEPLPHDVYDALSGGWLTTGSHLFEQLTTSIPHHDLKHWHTRAVKCSDVLTALQSLEDKAVEMFADSTTSKTVKVMTAPLRQVEWLVEHEGELIEILLRAEEVVGLVISGTLQALDDSIPPASEGLAAFFAAVAKLPGVGANSLDELKDLARKRLMDIIRPLLQRALYEAIFEVFIAFVSVDAVKKLYVPLHRRRDDAHRFILEHMMPQNSTRGQKTPKLTLTGLLTGKARSPRVGKRFKRRRRTSRGHTRIIDVILPPRRGRKSKAELALIAKKNKLQAVLRKAKRKRAQFKRLVNLKTEIKKLPKRYLDQLSKEERRIKTELKHRYQRARRDAFDRLKGQVRDGREAVAGDLRARRRGTRHYFPVMPNALGR